MIKSNVYLRIACDFSYTRVTVFNNRKINCMFRSDLDYLTYDGKYDQHTKFIGMINTKISSIAIIYDYRRFFISMNVTGFVYFIPNPTLKVLLK